VLHAHQAGLSPLNSLGQGKRILPVVPLFHANSWGLAHAAPLTGTTLVMPGPKLDGASIWDLIDAQRVYSAWGVPTVWLGLMAEIQARGAKPPSLGEMVVGGAAAAPSLIEGFEKLGVDVCHAWGMTEMSPVGTLGVLGPQHAGLTDAERLALKSTQGRRTYLVDLKIVDEAGKALPHDGKATGELFVRGPFVVAGYFNNPEASAAAIDAEGWFGTGDVASIDPEGFLTITDRAKDLIKSGGEWISSIDVENLALGHADIANCAVIAVPHPKWDERPVLVAVPAVEQPDMDAIRAHLAAHLAKWQLPDDIIFVEDLPLTATGKVSKLTLRERFKDHALGG
jgi:fatty-acyl-CoA synthase